MEKAPGLFRQALLFAAVAVVTFGAAVLILSLERVSPNAAPQAPDRNPETPLRPSGTGQPAGAALSHPLPYTATIRDCLPSGRQCSPTRYYVPKESK